MIALLTSTSTRDGTSTAGPLWYGLYPGEYTADRFDAGNVLVRGHGRRVQDRSGRWLLDGRAGLRTVTLGYDHPRVVAAIRRQLAELPFTPTVLYDRPPAVALEYAERLVAALPAELTHVRFGNTGSQMTDAALILSRYVRRLRGDLDRTEVVAFRGSFHGSGVGPCALTGSDFLHEAFAPLASGVHHVDQVTTADDVARLEEDLLAIGPGRVTALYLEPVVQSSLNILTADAASAVRALCDRWDIHLVVDEVSTGFGRTGTLTRSEALGLRADVMVLSKGMTSGYVPAAAMCVTDELHGEIHRSPFPGFPLATTTDGHALAMAAGLAVLDAYDEERVLANVAEREAQLRARLGELAASHPAVDDVRGVGLLWLVVLRSGGDPLPFETVERLRREVEDRGVLVGSDTDGLTLYPALNVTADEADEMVDALAATLAANRDRLER